MSIFKQKSVLLLQPFEVARGLAVIAFALLLGNLVVLIFETTMGLESPIFTMLNFNKERNLPTLYSSILLFLIFLLFIALSNTHPHTVVRKTSLFLGATFFFLSVDEAFRYHEQFTEVTREVMDLSGTFSLRAWVIPYGLAAMFVALVTIPFLRRIDIKHRMCISLAAFLYVFGAIGFELIGERYLLNHSPGMAKDFTYGLMTTIEESLEMLGCIVFVYALISLIKKHGGLLVGISD